MNYAVKLYKEGNMTVNQIVKLVMECFICIIPVHHHPTCLIIPYIDLYVRIHRSIPRTAMGTKCVKLVISNLNRYVFLLMEEPLSGMG